MYELQHSHCRTNTKIIWGWRRTQKKSDTRIRLDKKIELKRETKPETETYMDMKKDIEVSRDINKDKYIYYDVDGAADKGVD